MDVYVLDGEFKKIGFPIDNYISCIWHTCYCDIGDFELYLSAEPEVLSLLRTGAYLVRDQDMDDENSYYYNVMKIDCIKVETNEESGDHIIVTGKDLKTILNQRVIMNDNITTDTLQNVLNQVFEANILNPDNSQRKMEHIELVFLETDQHEHIIVEKGLHDYVGDWMISQCKTYEYGIIPCVNTQKSLRPSDIDYIIKKVKENKNVEFSYEYFDIPTSSYTRSTEKRKNVAIVVGDEVEGVHFIETVNDDMSGYSRYETYISSSISSDEYFNNDTITNKEKSYRDALIYEGEKALQETQIEENIECDIQSYGQYQLGKDFFVGDKVVIVNKYGIKAQAVISEVIDTHDETGRTIIPKFSDFVVI